MQKRPSQNTCRLENSEKEFAIEFLKDKKDEISIAIIDINEYYNEAFDFKTYYELIHANIIGSLYTFFGCSFESASSRSRYIYKVEGYFRGCHLSDLSKVLVKKYTVKLPRPLIGLFEIHLNERTINHLEENSFKINDNLKIAVKSSLVKDLSNYTKFYQKHYLDYNFEFLFENEVELSEVCDCLNIFKQFLDFNTGSQISIFPNSLIISKNDVINDLYDNQNYLSIDLSPNQIYLDTINTRFINNSILDDIALSRKVSNSFFSDAGLNTKDKYLFKILRQWFNNKRYRYVYYLYIDSNDWFHGTGRLISNVIFNNRFLNMIQALEHFHRIYFNNEKVDNPDYDTHTGGNLNKLEKFLQNEENLFCWVKAQIKKIKGKIDITLVQRLEELIEYVKGISSEVEFHDFSKKVKSFRDSMSHGYLDEVYKGVELEISFYQSKYLLLCCILKNLDIEENKINSIIQNNYNSWQLRDRILQLKHLQ